MRKIRLWQWLAVLAFFAVYLHFVASYCIARYTRTSNVESLDWARDAMMNCMLALKNYASEHGGLWPTHADPRIALGTIVNDKDLTWTGDVIPGRADMFSAFRRGQEIQFARTPQGNVKVLGTDYEYSNTADGPPAGPQGIHYMVLLDKSWPGLTLIGFGDGRVRIVEAWRVPKIFTRPGQSKLDLQRMQFLYYMLLISWGITGVIGFVLWQLTHSAFPGAQRGQDSLSSGISGCRCRRRRSRTGGRTVHHAAGAGRTCFNPGFPVSQILASPKQPV